MEAGSAAGSLVLTGASNEKAGTAALLLPLEEPISKPLDGFKVGVSFVLAGEGNENDGIDDVAASVEV